ncbi:MAG: MBL fold metallo-hydrolase [Sulfuricellaceae bacterium]|nr:MBL fold metallo-hydrolase [Sulfuricellaceae bacterium]
MHRFIVFFILLLAAGAPARAFELQSQQVVPGVYALVGPKEARSYDNYGLNATFGFAITPTGVVLIDSGSSLAGAKIIAAAIRKITPQPVRWVINTGSQDHRWLGNGYFAGKGAEIIALKRTVDTQREVGEQWLAALKPVLKEHLDGTVPLHAAHPIAADRRAFELGGRHFELIWLGDAHFAGDAVVWMPREKLLFSGDLIFVERILGVLPWSHAASWRKAFHAMEGLRPEHIVPGHGHSCDLATARRDTGDYLDWLVTEVGQAVADWEPIETAVDRLADAPKFKHLELYDMLHRSNLNRTYVELEQRELPRAAPAK